MTFCWNCREQIPPDDEHSYPRAGHYGEFMCRGCVESLEYVECLNCREFECPCCVIRAVDDYRDRPYCSSCASDAFTQCEGCSDWYRDAAYGGYCDDCRPESEWDDDDDEDSYCGLINDWDYTPYLTFYGDGPTYLGMELEVSINGDRMAAAAAVTDRSDAIYLKSDSSIDYGFEMVTHPCSHEYFANTFDWGVLDDLARHGGDGYGNGIHVHVSRKAFDSPAHTFRWMRLIYRNAAAVSAVARRNPNQWGSFTSHKIARFKDFAKGDKRSSERYSAINVQNDATFEVRVFRGSLNKQEVMAALDLVAASVEYTRNLTVPAIMNGGWTWPGFMAWVKDDGRYPALVAESAALVADAAPDYVAPAREPAPRRRRVIRSPEEDLFLALGGVPANYRERRFVV